MAQVHDRKLVEQQIKNRRAAHDPVSLADAIEELVEFRCLVLSGKVSWGNWSYLPKSVLLVHPKYEIDLRRVTTAAQALDWIAQVSGKTWATREDVGNLVQALDDLIGLQEQLCGWGTDEHPDGTKKRIHPRRLRDLGHVNSLRIFQEKTGVLIDEAEPKD